MTLTLRKMTDKQVAQWERTRDIGREVLEGIRDIKAGRIGRRFTVESFPIVRAREKSGLSGDPIFSPDRESD